MRVKVLVPLIASVLMGLIAALLALKVVRGKAAAPVHASSVRIVAAKAELAPGHTLSGDDLVLAPIEAKAPPPNTSTDPARLVGRVILTPMVAGEPVLETQLAPAGTAGGLSALVPDGMRAISVDTTDSSGLVGLLTPGCRVDVVTTAISTSSSEPAMSRILAQDVTVLAVGQKLSGSASNDSQTNNSRMVTLLVSPRDAAALDLGQTMARLRLILRGNSDRGEIDVDPVMMTDLRGGAAAPPVSPAPQVATRASTQPVVVVAATQPASNPPKPQAPDRVVTLILGNQEQKVSFSQQTKPGDREVSDTKDPSEPEDPFSNP